MIASQLSTDVSRPPHILVLSVSAGNGHLRASEALELAIRQLVPGAVVKNVDVLSLSVRPLRFCFSQAYVGLIDSAPSVLGFFYNRMDHYRPPERQSHRWDHVRVALEKVGMRRFLKLLRSEPWDLIINTHFLSGEVVASLCQKHQCHAQHVTVVTDFESHRLWATQPCSHYYMATEEAARYLECFGVPGEDITVTGIPIHPVFAEAKSKSECRARLGLSDDRPVILQLAGGHGVGPIEAIYRALLDVEVPIHIVVVTGRNAAAQQHLPTLSIPPRHRATIFGYRNDIDELMAAADLAVTKPGGLTTSEAMARGLPLAIVNPVPGQEERNSDYLLENGAAIKINHVPTLAFKVTQLLRDRERLAQLQANARRLGHPRAAFTVVEHALKLIQPAAVASC
jgi:processive 1,2-diacylglycerol beta-glucosyltransferase